MTREEFEDKLYNGKFTERELHDLRWFDIDIEEDAYNNLKSIDTIESSDLNRWTRFVSFIFSYKDEYFCLDYQEGLTEYQDDIFDSQPYKVKKVEKQVTVIEFKPVK